MKNSRQILRRKISPGKAAKADMNAIFNLHRETNRSWPKRKSTTSSPLRSPFFILSISLLALFLLVFLSISPFQTSKSLFSSETLSAQSSQCGNFRRREGEENFLWYAPHSGFSNQLSELKNAAVMAGILNRTLVVPPILDHHAVVLGSCPKFRVTPPNEIRASVWNHAVELMKSGRYVSMADIIDISPFLSASLRVIDLRDFAASFCGVNMDSTCVNDLRPGSSSSLFDSLRECGNVLSGMKGNIGGCVYAVEEDCRTTVWIYENDDDGELDSFQPDEQLKRKKKISYVRRRRDVYKTLGPGSEAGSAAVLAFGSVFTAPYKGSESYIDIPKVKNSEFLPFVPEILSAGKKFAVERIRDPFVCAQLRLLDGQFKNHWKATFQGLRQKLESLNQGDAQPINIFVMTDLPRGNWSGTYLGEIASNEKRFKLHFLGEEDSLVAETARQVGKRGRRGNVHCPGQKLPDVLLYIEESVCSCASLGFVGTAGSTIAESIELMRKSDVCSLRNRTAR